MHLLKRFLRDEQGNVFMLVGIFLTVLVGIIGVTLTLGRSTMIRTRMQNASDAAALAGAIPDNGTVSDAERRDIARRYFALNFPDGYLGTDMTANRITPQNLPGGGMQVDALHTRSTDMVNVLDSSLNTTTVGAHTVVKGVKGSNLIEMVMVMDASGSMMKYLDTDGRQRIEGAYEAAGLVIDEILVKLQPKGSRLGWVQYTHYCAVESGPCGRPPSERVESYALDPHASDLNGYNQDYRNRVLTYGPDWAVMTTNGGDAMERAEILLANPPANGVTRAVIYMTDGFNNVYKDIYYGNNAPQADQPVKNACDSLKAKNVVIYAVGFGDTMCGGAPYNGVVKQCASDASKFFCARNGTELRAAFQTIVTSVKNIRISE